MSVSGDDSYLLGALERYPQHSAACAYELWAESKSIEGWPLRLQFARQSHHRHDPCGSMAQKCLIKGYPIWGE